MEPVGATDADVARRYHDATKHSPASVAAGRRFLDWANQPIPYKVYPSVEAIELPLAITPGTEPTMRVLLGRARAERSAAVDLNEIARLCILSNGVTRVRRHPGGELAFRAAGTTGALYHIELYVACADLPDLPAGVYHFGAHDNALRRLRAGDHRAALVDATGREATVSDAPLVVVATSTFWRNAWKYESRAWRHIFWDGGTVAANLLALTDAGGLPARILLGFADAGVNALLDVDGTSEAAVWLAPIGADAPRPPPAPDPPRLDLPTVALSAREIAYPLIQEAQAGTSLASGADAAAWRRRAAEADTRSSRTPDAPVVTPPRRVELPADPIERVIRRRGSTRRFARRPIPADALAALIEAATAPLAADFAPRHGRLTDLCLIVNAVDGLDPGAYLHREDGIGLEQLRTGDFRSQAGWLALGQDLAADASVNLYWLADLDGIFDAVGGRGYRAAQLDAAIRAEAQGVGATGLTFFDDEVTRFFGPAAEGMGVMFLLAVGKSAQLRG